MVGLSTDGSFNLEDGTAGSGMILRDCKGDVIFASYRKLFQCNDALEAELQAIKEGLQLAFIHASSPVVLQTDSAMALKMIATGTYDRSLYGVLVVEIKSLLLNREVTFYHLHVSLCWLLRIVSLINLPVSPQKKKNWLKGMGKLHWLKLLHFHVGSMIPSTDIVFKAASEAAGIYCTLVND
ncbi:Arginine decarboxylase [Hordeum vulgare]|nr:Arginine decarboxylase [Hordeum vulgare]